MLNNDAILVATRLGGERALRGRILTTPKVVAKLAGFYVKSKITGFRQTIYYIEIIPETLCGRVWVDLNVRVDNHTAYSAIGVAEMGDQIDGVIYSNGITRCGIVHDSTCDLKHRSYSDKIWHGWDRRVEFIVLDETYPDSEPDVLI